MKPFSKHIKSLISLGEIEGAIQQLTMLNGSKFEDDVLHLSARYYNLLGQNRKGIISLQEAHIEFARITKSLIEIITLVDEEEIIFPISSNDFSIDWYKENRFNNYLNYIKSFIGKEINNYKLIRHIGTGGFGNVFYAKHTLLNTEVALKVSHPITNEDVFGKLIDISLNAIKNLKHEYIAKVTDAGKITIDNSSYFYLISEFIDGGNLKEYCLKNPLDSTKEIYFRLDVFKKICEAILYSHNQSIINYGLKQKGIYHGDIKPENILLTKTGIPKINDFLFIDLQKALKITFGRLEYLPDNSSRAAGTIGYMSYEQFNEGIITAKSDIYSLGITLFEIMSGLKPADYANLYFRDFEDVKGIIKNELIPDFVCDLIFKSTRKNPLDRISDIKNIIDLIEKESLC